MSERQRRREGLSGSRRRELQHKKEKPEPSPAVLVDLSERTYVRTCRQTQDSTKSKEVGKKRVHALKVCK